MDTRRLTIKERAKEFVIALVAPENFVTEPADPIEPAEVLADPKFTLYCLDLEHDAVLFVESNNPAGLDKSAFYYQGQYETAVGLVSMPLSTFHSVAKEIPAPAKGTIFLHSVGRCGSTLLSKAFEAVPAIHSLSEPDELTQMIGLRELDGGKDAWLRDLISSSVRWRWKPRIGAPPDYVAIKTRSEVIANADLICDAFPDAKNVFLYRDGLSWVESVFRTASPDWPMDDPEKNRMMENRWSWFIRLIPEYRQEEAPMNPMQIRCLAWIQCMEDYLDLAEGGVPFCALRYEELTKNPIAMLSQVFEYCGIEVPDWKPIEDALGRDSQEGTIYDREVLRQRAREMPVHFRQNAIDLIASRPKLKVPGVILPNTIQV